jgi:hypothetical protein
MTVIVRQTDWCTLTLDTAQPRLFFRQRWRYEWIAPPGQPRWTYPEKHRFHTAADRMIWGVWSNRAFLTATGTSDIARVLAGKRIPISFDVEWVLGHTHWVVEVRKVPPGFMAHPTRVEWPKRRIFLCTEDFKKDRHAGGIVAHEFGHSMGNTGVLNRGDEYRKSSPHHADKASVINVGRALRDRHFRTMVEQLDQMAPRTRFATELPK